MVPEIPLIFDDKDIFNVLATRHLTDRQIPVIDISEAGRLPYSRGDLFKVERLKDSFFILPNDGYSDFFSKEEVGFMQRFVYNRSMKLPPTRT